MGFIKTGLGRRIALQMIRLLGKRTLGLAYGLAFADLILSPAMPSKHRALRRRDLPDRRLAGAAALIHIRKMSLAAKSGTFLITCIGNVNDVTAALFMTGYTGNLLAVKLAANAGVTLSWGSWFIAALLPCLVSFLIVPLLVYWLTRPEIKHTPDAPDLARKELAQMGSMTRGEWLMLATVGVLLVLWIFGSSLGVDATTASFVGLSILLLSGVLTWEDVKSEKGAWDTLIWFAALLMMANQLKKLGFTSWFGNLIGDSIGSTMHGTSWIIILLLLNAAYFYTHYFFASGNAQNRRAVCGISGRRSASEYTGGADGAHAGVYQQPVLLSYAVYPRTRPPFFFGAGYVPTGVWWRTGFIISLFNQAVFFDSRPRMVESVRVVLNA
ncbi:putative cation transporter [Salmonella enterica subsp. enterica]|uniref:Putative cation transporter n=1 Tax=Salmonella enterica I TaxID=59201 RepID=A0A3S4I059_SALET|nr:putative cation transporter [Salmonella enterica subsp. enterica]